MLVKVITITLAVWLLNVAFVAVHELGHSAAAICTGEKVFSVYVSPTGYNGATTYTLPENLAQRNTVIACGLAATVLATLLACTRKAELAVYVLGLRTAESLTNFTQGSDMASLVAWIGSWSYPIALSLACLVMLCMGYTLYDKRLKTYSPGHPAPEI